MYFQLKMVIFQPAMLVCQSTFRIDTPFNKHVTWKSGNPPRAMGTAYEPGSELLVLGMVIQPLIGILIMGI